MSPLEIVLASIWQDVLALDRVGIHDSFLDLGGDSLLAMRVGTEARQRLGLVLPLHALLQSPTVAELAAAIGAQSAREP